MKKLSLISVLAVVVGTANAATTFYYETTGKCDGLFINPKAKTCAEAVTRVTTPSSSGKNFAGYYAGGRKVIDKNGNVLIGRGVAQSLFADADVNDANNKSADAVYTRGDDTLVTIYNSVFFDDNHTNWFRCSNSAYYTCTYLGDYVAHQPVVCWSASDTTHSNGYDYAFQAWKLSNGEYIPASSNPSWDTGYVHDPMVAASGDSSKPEACNSKLLGSDVDESKTSYGVVKPFACKRFSYGSGSWKNYYDTENGQFVLDMSVYGTCTYKLECNAGFIPSDAEHKSISCTNAGCRGFFNGNVSSLSGKGITATCIKQTSGGTEPGGSEPGDTQE